jgi:NADPH:quinone reductase-like Zn-dependent oxidoreductase
MAARQRRRGGVGGFTVQLAKEAGAIVIATASPRSTDMVRAFGADHIVDYTATTIAEAVKDPVDVVVNLVAGSREDTGVLLDVTKPDGVLVSAASPGGEFPERDATVIFFSVRSDPVQLARIVDRVEAGHVRLDISDRCPLADARLVDEQSEAVRSAAASIEVPTCRRSRRRGRRPEGGYSWPTVGYQA